MKKYKNPSSSSYPHNQQIQPKVSKINQSYNLKNLLNSRYKKYILKDYTFLQDYVVVESINSLQFIAKIVHTQQHVLFTKTPLFEEGGDDKNKGTTTINNREKILERFESLAQLFAEGVVLADNMFILQEESGKMYIYVIEAYMGYRVPKPVKKPAKDQNHQNPDLPKRQNQQNQKSNNNESFSHSIIYCTLGEHIEITSQQLQDITQDPSNQENNVKGMEILMTRQKLIDKVKILLDCVHQKGQPYFGLTTQKVILDDEGNVYLAPYSIDLFNDNETRNARSISQWPNQNNLLLLHTRMNEGEAEENMRSFVQAYYSPELLECAQKNTNKINKTELSIKRLLKNDIWGFGCIAMEIFFYSSPIFHAPTVQLQLRAIQSLLNPQNNSNSRSEEFLNEEYLQHQFASAYGILEQNLDILHPLINLILNSLEWNETDRILCSERITCGSETRRNLSNTTKTTQMTKTINKNSYCRSRSKSKQKYQISKKLNTSQEQEQEIFPITNIDLPIRQINKNSLQQQNCNFTLKILHITNAYIRKQLRINIYLDKQYSIFISPSNPQANLYKINKVIKISTECYPQIYEILSQPILIELRQDEKCEKIWVNLSTLVFTTPDGKARIWNRPLIGTYGVKTNKICSEAAYQNKEEEDRIRIARQGFKLSKVKLFSELKTPENCIFTQQISSLGNKFKERIEKYEYEQKNKKEEEKTQKMQTIDIPDDKNSKQAPRQKVQETKDRNTDTNKENQQFKETTKEQKDNNKKMGYQNEHLHKIYNNLLEINNKWGLQTGLKKGQQQQAKGNNSNEMGPLVEKQMMGNNI